MFMLFYALWLITIAAAFIYAMHVFRVDYFTMNSKPCYLRSKWLQSVFLVIMCVISVCKIAIDVYKFL